ncbi:MAG: hypothetical protein AAGC55_09570 [Myxococcota bacterium]
MLRRRGNTAKRIPEWLPLGLTLFALATVACSTRDTVAIELCVSGEQCGDLLEFCAGQSATSPGGGDDAPLCAGELAADTFRYALCGCADLDSNSEFTSDAFDSRDGPYQSGQSGGSIAVNGKVQSNRPMIIDGSLISAGEQGVHTSSVLTVTGDLHTGGDLGDPGAEVAAGGDVTVTGDIALTSLSVGGALTVPGDRTVAVADGEQVGELVRAPVEVAEPCACSTEQHIDVAAIVATHRTDNHNAALGIDADLLSDFRDDVELALDCGRFYFRRIQGQGSVTITVSGRTAIFVAENITLNRDLTIVVADGGLLDLFVAGQINTSGAVAIGSPDSPAQVRVYVAGGGSINLSSGLTLAGNLYAPRTDLALSGDTEIFGAVFVNRMVSASPITVHYDRAVSTLAESCAD